MLFVLYHVMIAEVNSAKPKQDRIPHVRIHERGRVSHGFDWTLAMTEYRRLFPRSFVTYAVYACLTSVVGVAIVFVVLRVWEYTLG